MIRAALTEAGATPLTRRCGAAAWRPVLSLLAVAAAQGAAAQLVQDTPVTNRLTTTQPTSTLARAFYVTPTLGTSLQATNNANLSATDKQSDLILNLIPGVRLGGQSGRIRGYLNYALNASLSANQAETSSFTNFLAAQLNAEAVPSYLFIDASASISQQYINPFGTQSPDSSLNNSNRTEVSTLNLAPYIKGQIAGQVNYVGRVFYGYTNSGSSSASDSTLWGGRLNLDSSTRWARLSWGMDLSYRDVKFNPGIGNQDQLNILSLNYAITPEFVVSVRGNVETSNLITLDTETTTGWGGGLRWTPSPRTKLYVEYDNRAFGNSHVYSFDYRTPHTVWAISSTQSLSTGQRNTGTGSSGSAYDLLFSQFATVEPDPVKREQLVNNFMQANGIDPKSALNVGYLPDQVQLELHNVASAAWLGRRSTLIFNAYQTQTKNLGAASNPGNGFANGNQIDWLGGGVTWSHRLTPSDVLSLNGNGQHTKQADGTRETTLWVGALMWTSQLSERVNLGLSARYSAQTGTATYDEASVLAHLVVQF